MTELSETGDCACCGRSFEESELERLGSRGDVAICTGCVDGLYLRRRNLVRAVPVLTTTDLTASMRFWASAGFTVSRFGADFASANKDGVELHLVDASGAGRDRGEAYLHVRGIDDVHAAWASAGLSPTALRDKPWEMREFNVVDPGDNMVRVGQNL